LVSFKFSLLLREIYAEELFEGRKFLAIADFKKLNGPVDQLEYLVNHGTKIGAGSSRAVFLVNNRHVIKMAKMRSFSGHSFDVGRAQNEAEVDLYTNPDIKPFVAEVYDYDKNYNWIMSELVRPLRESEEFEKLTGVRWPDFVSLCSRGMIPDSRWKPLAEETYKDNRFVQSFVDMLEKTDIDAYDFTALTQLGKTRDGRVVLLDYGFSTRVRDKYY
jgi:hypothetical protein